jgi:hypothetical protein
MPATDIDPGHFVPVEYPAEFVAALCGWLDR